MIRSEFGILWHCLGIFSTHAYPKMFFWVLQWTCLPFLVLNHTLTTFIPLKLMANGRLSVNAVIIWHFSRTYFNSWWVFKVLVWWKMSQNVSLSPNMLTSNTVYEVVVTVSTMEHLYIRHKNVFNWKYSIWFGQKLALYGIVRAFLALMHTSKCSFEAWNRLSCHLWY